MSQAVKVVTVRIPVELHRECKEKAARRGDTLEGVGRAAFAAYAGRADDAPGSPLEKYGVAVGSDAPAAVRLHPVDPESIPSGLKGTEKVLALQAFDPECRNREYHREGRACRFCGGAR
jgi:hypothetical protein